jgi:hypothetical protein
MPTWLVMLTCGLLPHRRSSDDARSRSSATVDTSNAGLLAASCAALCIVCSIAVLVASAISSWVAPNASATGYDTDFMDDGTRESGVSERWRTMPNFSAFVMPSCYALSN